MVHAAVVAPYNHLRENHDWSNYTAVYFLLLKHILSVFGKTFSNVEKYILGSPVRLYPVGFPRIAVVAGTVGQVFSVQSWFSFWLRMLHYSADRP